MKYRIEFSPQELQAVVTLLQQGPYNVVAGLLVSIERQVRDQENAEQNALQAKSEADWADKV